MAKRTRQQAEESRQVQWQRERDIRQGKADKYSGKENETEGRGKLTSSVAKRTRQQAEESRQVQWWGRERDSRQRKADKYSGKENETAGRGRQTSTVVGQRTRQQAKEGRADGD